MSRLSYEQLDKLKEHYGVDRIWSWSRLNTYTSQPWMYRITYLDKLKPDTSNVYSEWGTIGHDIVQSVYEGTSKKEDMYPKFEEAVLEWRLKEDHHKFMNENVEKGYLNNLTHYFKHSDILPYDVTTEKPVKIVFENGDDKVAFVGYVDGLYEDEDGNIVILDFKSSSKGEYTGAKLKNSSRQLLLYSIGIHQATGLPYDKIKARFDMMKYVTVSFLQKNGKWSKPVMKERSKWVQEQEKRIKKLLVDNDVDIFDVESMTQLAIMENSLESLPDYVQEKFKVGAGFIDVDVSEENAKELESWILENINECYEKEKGDWEIEFPEPVLDASNEFYFNVLAKGALKFHKGYQEEQVVNQVRRNKEVDLDALESFFN